MLLFRKTLLLYFLVLPFLDYSQNNCDDLPKTFYNHNEALNKIRKTKFRYVEKNQYCQ